MTVFSEAITRTLALKDLRPSTHVNATLSQLVACITDPAAISPNLTPDTVVTLRHTCAQAEYYMESHWAEHIAASATPHRAAQAFPYWDNYSELTRHEVSLLTTSGQPATAVRRVLIIGSGPLPMSALHLCTHLKQAVIDHVDSDPVAAKQGEALLVALDLNSGTYYCADGTNVQLAHRYDLVMIAALAGETTATKQAIIDNTLPHLNADGRILVRSARGVRGLLYPVFAATDLQRVELLAEHHPTDDTINSVFIYKKGQA